MRYLLCLSILLVITGCTASFQPFPAGVSKADLAQRDETIGQLVEAIKVLDARTQPKTEVKAKVK